MNCTQNAVPMGHHKGFVFLQKLFEGVGLTNFNSPSELKKTIQKI